MFSTLMASNEDLTFFQQKYEAMASWLQLMYVYNYSIY